MKLDLVQQFRSPPISVAAALTDPALYPALGSLPRISVPVVLHHERVHSITNLRVQYRFEGEISSAARRVLDPDRLTWVQESRFDHTSLSATFSMVPDHYAGRLRCVGTFRLVPAESGCERHVEIDLSVRVPVVGRAVEGAFASGLHQHLDHEVDLIEAYIDQRAAS